MAGDERLFGRDAVAVFGLYVLACIPVGAFLS